MARYRPSMPLFRKKPRRRGSVYPAISRTSAWVKRSGGFAVPTAMILGISMHSPWRPRKGRALRSWRDALSDRGFRLSNMPGGRKVPARLSAAGVHKQGSRRERAAHTLTGFQVLACLRGSLIREARNVKREHEEGARRPQGKAGFSPEAPRKRGGPDRRGPWRTRTWLRRPRRRSW